MFVFTFTQKMTMQLRSFILLVMLALCPTLVFAQRTITVMGGGHADAKPDYATVTMMLSAQDITAQGVFDKTSENTTRLLKSFADAGIAASDIEQQGVALNPSYDYSGGGGAPPRLAGYHVMSTYIIKVRNLKQLPKVIDLGTLAGASNVALSGYGAANSDQLEESATKKALGEAREKAERLAEQMGGKLGEILSITDAEATGGANMSGGREEEEHRGMIVAGSNSQKISKSVELKVTFSIK